MTKKYYLKIYGCPMNTADAERIIAPLLTANWTETSDRFNAELLIFVTCSVRQKSEDKIYGLGEEIKKLREKNPGLKVLITGCVATRITRGNEKIDKKLVSLKKEIKRRLWFADYVVDVPAAVKTTKKLAKISDDTTLLIRHLSPVTAYIPISTGCDNFCSYCVVPYTRGPLKNRPVNAILKDVGLAIKAGKKEIYLLGQNVNSYPDFPTLLSLIDAIPGEYWIRFISSHPKDISKKLIYTIAAGARTAGTHITPYLHFALQSGSDTVLKRMNRHYSYKRFKTLVDYAREKVPGIAVTTDIIVGFPGETEHEFQATVKAMNECKFDMAYISIYSPRPGTVSAETMEDDVPKQTKKERHQLLTDLLRQQCHKRNKKLVGKNVQILVEKPRLGRTQENFEVTLETPLKTGNLANVKITKATDWSLTGVPVS